MSISKRIGQISQVTGTLVQNPGASLHGLSRQPERLRGVDYARTWVDEAESVPVTPGAGGNTDDGPNALREYFEGVEEGPGIWKWVHYFDIYHRHMAKFVGQPELNVVEVGVFSGGSLPMWRRYFGDGCCVHGVDIEEACKAYENAFTTIHVGDQADRAFWRRFKESVPAVDVFIDDGGHEPEQQMVTLGEMLPHVRAGGVYLCEDVAGRGNRFAAFAHALADELNEFGQTAVGQDHASRATPFQSAVHSVHAYPFVVVIEKRDRSLRHFIAPRRGTQWQPFL